MIFFELQAQDVPYSLWSICMYETDQIHLKPKTSLFPALDIPVFWVTYRPALIYRVKIEIMYQLISLQWVMLQFSVCVWVTLCLWSHILLQLPVHKSNSVTWSAFTRWCTYPDRVSDWLSFFFSLFMRWAQIYVLTMSYSRSHIRKSPGVLRAHPHYVC